MRIGKYDYVFVCNYKDFIVYALNEDGNLGQVFMLEKMVNTCQAHMSSTERYATTLLKIIQMKKRKTKTL